MAQDTNTYDRYDIIGSREDLSDVIYNIAPTEVPFQSNVGMGRSENILKEWQTDTLPAAADIKMIDGDAFAGTAIPATTRLGNYHQISWYAIVVSRRADIVNKAGRRSEMGYQIARHAKAMRRSMEHTLTLRKVAKLGSASAASELAGYPAWIKTNDLLGGSGASPTVSGGVVNSAGTPGTARALKEAFLLTAARNCYDQGGNPDMIMVPTELKAGISAYLMSSDDKRIATPYQDHGKTPMKGTTVVGAVDVYVTDFFVLDIVPNRFSPAGASASEVIMPDTEYWEVSYLSPFHRKEIASIGDAERTMLIVDYTLCAKNEASSAVITAINQGSAVVA